MLTYADRSNTPPNVLRESGSEVCRLRSSPQGVRREHFGPEPANWMTPGTWDSPGFAFVEQAYADAARFRAVQALAGSRLDAIGDALNRIIADLPGMRQRLGEMREDLRHERGLPAILDRTNPVREQVNLLEVLAPTAEEVDLLIDAISWLPEPASEVEALRLDGQVSELRTTLRGLPRAEVMQLCSDAARDLEHSQRWPLLRRAIEADPLASLRHDDAMLGQNSLDLVRSTNRYYAFARFPYLERQRAHVEQVGMAIGRLVVSLRRGLDRLDDAAVDLRIARLDIGSVAMILVPADLRPPVARTA